MEHQKDLIRAEIAVAFNNYSKGVFALKLKTGFIACLPFFALGMLIWAMSLVTSVINVVENGNIVAVVKIADSTLMSNPSLLFMVLVVLSVLSITVYLANFLLRQDKAYEEAKMLEQAKAVVFAKVHSILETMHPVDAHQILSEQGAFKNNFNYELQNYLTNKDLALLVGVKKLIDLQFDVMLQVQKVNNKEEMLVLSKPAQA